MLFVDEHLDEEETKEVESILFWMRNLDFSVNNLEQVFRGLTKLQITLHYDVECSDEALDNINTSFEHHIISEAVSVVPRYEAYATIYYII